jgi:AcrR family transcriptional regulator
MPPKARITKDMIIDAAFEIIKAEGIGMVNVRNIAKCLHCSTQPILYYFSGMDEIKTAAYKKADDYHTSFIMDIQEEYPNPLLEIGMRYIKFAVAEKELFKFLFQSDQFAGKDLVEIIGTDELLPVLHMMSQAMTLPTEQAKKLFERIFFTVHGIAGLLANNRMAFDREHVQELLKDALKVGMISIDNKGEKK